jgi:hypothetical protein
MHVFFTDRLLAGPHPRDISGIVAGLQSLGVGSLTIHPQTVTCEPLSRTQEAKLSFESDDWDVSGPIVTRRI